MLKNLLDGLLSIYIVLSFVLLIAGNIARFMCWVKCRKANRDIYMRYTFDLWGNEWGAECSKEEIRNLKQMVRQFEEKHKEIDNEYFRK